MSRLICTGKGDCAILKDSASHRVRAFFHILSSVHIFILFMLLPHFLSWCTHYVLTHHMPPIWTLCFTAEKRSRLHHLKGKRPLLLHLHELYTCHHIQTFWPLSRWWFRLQEILGFGWFSKHCFTQSGAKYTLTLMLPRYPFLTYNYVSLTQWQRTEKHSSAQNTSKFSKNFVSVL